MYLCCRMQLLSASHLFIMVTLLRPAATLGTFVKFPINTIRLASLPSIGKAATFVASSLGTSALCWAHTHAHLSSGFPATVLTRSGDDLRAHADRTAAGQPATARHIYTESGRSCESAEAAFRDVILNRLAALETEVAQLRAAAERRAGAKDSDKQPQGEQQKDGNTDEQRVAAGAVAGIEGTTADECGGRGSYRNNSGSATEAVAAGLSKLHPKITRLVQSGYLESLHHLRQRLMVDEWEGGGRQRALQRGVAEFEAVCSDKGLPLSWEELSQLYKDPQNLDVIRDPRVRSTARATLHRVLDERHEKVREGATQLAKELADVVTHGPGNLLSGLWGLLPLPGFLKGK